MRILFATPLVHLPHVVTGGSMDIHEMAVTLGAMGHDVAVAAALPSIANSARVEQLPYRLRQLADRHRLIVYRDTDNGYDTFRVGHWLMPRLVQDRILTWRPDVVIIQGHLTWNLGIVAVAAGCPVVLRLIDQFGVGSLAGAAAADRRVAELLTSPLFRLTCNSRFTAAEAASRFGFEPPVVYPMIRSRSSAGSDRDARYVTFVSPVPAKGLSIALGVAELLPDQEFLFVNGWSTRRDRLALRRALRQLPNVAVRQNSMGLDDVFRSTKAVLMPSQVHEAFGRVIVEAGHRGIPCVASRIGGIPEAMGASGVLVESSEPPERWARELRGILTDPVHYADLCAGALANAAREEFKDSEIGRQLIDILEEHASGYRVPDRT